MDQFIIFHPVGSNIVILTINTEHHILPLIFRLFFIFREMPMQEVLAQTC